MLWQRASRNLDKGWQERDCPNYQLQDQRFSYGETIAPDNEEGKYVRERRDRADVAGKPCLDIYLRCDVRRNRSNTQDQLGCRHVANEIRNGPTKSAEYGCAPVAAGAT